MTHVSYEKSRIYEDKVRTTLFFRLSVVITSDKREKHDIKDDIKTTEYQQQHSFLFVITYNEIKSTLQSICISIHLDFE
jgi:hypothetical protein